MGPVVRRGRGYAMRGAVKAGHGSVLDGRAVGVLQYCSQMENESIKFRMGVAGPLFRPRFFGPGH